METINILVIGDLVGEKSIHLLKEQLPKLRKEHEIDFCIVNAENVAGGMGITTKAFHDLLELNIDAITMGNHTWGKKDIFSFIDNSHIMRPANYSKGVVGKGYQIYECKQKKICVMNLIGRTDMAILSDNPFIKAEEILQEIKGKADIILLDFHAEATAEKIAMKYFLDGKITALFGTHTHVQTADEEVTSKGTAYITDVGMTGPKNSVIGMDIQASTKRFVTSLPERYKLAEGDYLLNGCIIKVEAEKKQDLCRALSIERIFLK